MSIFDFNIFSFCVLKLGDNGEFFFFLTEKVTFLHFYFCDFLLLCVVNYNNALEFHSKEQNS